jgi:hypothetical protein
MDGAESLQESLPPPPAKKRKLTDYFKRRAPSCAAASDLTGVAAEAVESEVLQAESVADLEAIEDDKADDETVTENRVCDGNSEAAESDSATSGENANDIANYYKIDVFSHAQKLHLLKNVRRVEPSFSFPAKTMCGRTRHFRSNGLRSIRGWFTPQA